MLHEIDAEEHGPLGEDMAAAVSTCVHCGFCLAACPTYQELGQETDSPRGRIVLMKEVLEGSLPLETALPHVDACLGCLACEPACPSGVPYRDLISPFRAKSQRERKLTLVDRLARKLTETTLPYPNRFRAAAISGRLAKPFAFLMPGRLKAMLGLLPSSLPTRQTWKAVNPAIGRRRARVALLTGCAQSVLAPDINTATIEVLTENGVEVLVPQDQGCCGALSWHVGNQTDAMRFAKKNLDAFPVDVDAIVTNAAGCGSGMHEYHLILKGTPSEQRAVAFRDKVCDVSKFLQTLGTSKSATPLKQSVRVAYHDACHLSNAQGVKQQPRDLLKSVPGIELVEIAASHLCCGSAGTYNIDQPEIAASLGEQKVRNILATSCDLVATGNIGCMTQLQTHLASQGKAVPVRHTMQVLRDAYRGTLVS